MTVINVVSPQVQVREIRLNSITGYAGAAGELVRCSRANKLQEKTRKFSQCMMCASTAAFCQLSMIMDGAMINHAPVGCASDFPGFQLVYRIGQMERELPPLMGRFFNTNLEERDTVFGGTEKLAAAVHEVYRRVNPKVIFITTSCASGIIGDDIESVASEASEELGIPVISCTCEGFRSRIWTTGFDSAYHSIVRGLVKPARTKTSNKVNIINFWGMRIFESLFDRLGLEANYVVPFSTVEQLESVSEAVASVQICSTLGSYFGAALEQIYGVPEIKSPPPYGVLNTDNWLREIGRVAGVEDKVEALIAEEHARIQPQLEEYRRKFAGKTAYLTAGAAHGHAIIALLSELGFKIRGAAIFHHDPIYDNNDPASDALAHDVKHYGDIKNYSVCNKQSYEIVNLLHKHRPDVLVARHGGIAHWGARLGIPSFLFGDEHLGIGYQGILNYADKLEDTLTSQEYISNFSKHATLPYTDWWLDQDPYHFLEGETDVKVY